MSDFFDLSSNRAVRNVTPPSFNYLKAQVSKELTMLQHYYNNARLHVPNEHMLVRLMKGLNISLKRDIYSYVEMAEDIGEELSRGLGLITAYDKGEYHETSMLYNNRVKELLISTDERFEIEEAERNWHELEPIRILYHPFSDLTFDELDGYYSGSNESGISVILLNLPMLALQYRGWLKHEFNKGTIQGKTISQFLYAYPLNNARRSHLDIVLFNNLYYRLIGEPTAGYKRVLPKVVKNLSNEVNTECNKILESLVGKLDYSTILANTPAFSKNNLLEVIQMPNMPITKNVRSSLLIAYLPYLDYLLSIHDRNNTSGKLDRGLEIEIRLLIRRIRSDSMFTRDLPFAIQQKIDKLSRKIK